MNRGLIAILLFLGYACSSTSTEENVLVGQWKAKWSASEELAKTSRSNVLIKTEMDGKMIFDSNNRLKIAGYGYPGCIFSEDTIENELSWSFDGTTIKLFNEKDSFIMEYKVQNISTDSASFLFLDDIRIDLIKI